MLVTSRVSLFLIFDFSVLYHSVFRVMLDLGVSYTIYDTAAVAFFCRGLKVNKMLTSCIPLIRLLLLTFCKSSMKMPFSFHFFFKMHVVRRATGARSQ